MTPRRLLLTERALRDLECRARILRNERGRAFADAWMNAFLDWLEALAEGGAVIGTQHPGHRNFRTFGYKRQATILAEFADPEMRVVRVYFAGQDWSD